MPKKRIEDRADSQVPETGSAMPVGDANDAGIVAESRIFISYSWDSEDHKNWVRLFASKLVSYGIHVLLDAWELSPGDSLTAFMEQSCKSADAIIVVCSRNYATRANERMGGVGYEGQILSSELLSNSRARIIPIVVGRSSEPLQDIIPSFLGGRYFVDFRNGVDESESVDALLRAIYRVPRFRAPVRGSPPILQSHVDDVTAPAALATYKTEQQRRTKQKGDRVHRGLVLPSVVSDIALLCLEDEPLDRQRVAAVRLASSRLGIVRSVGAEWFQRELHAAQPDALGALVRLIVDRCPEVRRFLPTVTLGGLANYYGLAVVVPALEKLGGVGAAIAARALLSRGQLDGPIDRLMALREVQPVKRPPPEKIPFELGSGLTHPLVPPGSTLDCGFLRALFSRGAVDGDAMARLHPGLGLVELEAIGSRINEVRLNGVPVAELARSASSNEVPWPALRALFDGGLAPERVVELCEDDRALWRGIERHWSRTMTRTSFGFWVLSIYAFNSSPNAAYVGKLASEERLFLAERFHTSRVADRMRMANIGPSDTLEPIRVSERTRRFAPTVTRLAEADDIRRRATEVERRKTWSVEDFRDLYFHAADDPVALQAYLNLTGFLTGRNDPHPAYSNVWLYTQYPTDEELVPTPVLN